MAFNEQMEQLKNKLVKGVFISECGEYLRFETNIGSLIWQAVGDCCSKTWFADILGIDVLINSVVYRIERLDMSQYDVLDGRCKQERDKAYGFRFRCTMGHFEVIFRNSSNGYYGGWIEFVEPGKPFSCAWKDLSSLSEYQAI
jgi:hypothetical protein